MILLHLPLKSFLSVGYILFIRYHMKLKKQISFNNNENPLTPSHHRNKVGTQSMNFGKSIKLKAQMLQDPHSMREQVNGVIQPLKMEQQMKRSMLKRGFSFDSEDDLSLKSKMVRFEDEESEEQSLQYSRNRKKNQSILKKSPSIDKHSVNSGTSDLGAIDFFPSKSALRPQGSISPNQKYDKTVKMLKYQNVKFVDNLFPPGMASLCYSKTKISEFSGIRWVRLEDLFKSKKLVLFNQQSDKKCIIRRGMIPYSENMVTAFNAISNSNRCLQRMFQEQKPFGLCIYFVRINHDGVWKYVIIDDYVPVVRSSSGDVPAFLNVQENSDGEVEIWPFLAQKALAKLNNCYECLFQDTPDNLIYEYSGVQCDQLNLKEDSSEFRFRSSVLHSQTIILASYPLNSSFLPEATYALREDSESSCAYFNLDVRMRIIEPYHGRNLTFDLVQLRKLFGCMKVFRIEEGNFSQGCIIKQTKGTMSLRKLTIKDHPCPCTLSLVQKDKKYYRNNGYDYVWARMMLVTRDGSNGYRWIAGKYEKARIISISCQLEPGEYFLLVGGDWKSRAYEMVLSYQGSQQVEISRETFEQHPRIITETCVDLAQRFGIFKQVNRNICTYRLIDRTNGFIIENNNNEANRQVFFHKIYPLPGKSGQTYELIQRQKYLQEDEKEVETLIQANSHFTFVLRYIDGFHPALDGFQFE